MNKTSVTILLGFALMFAAGAVVGMVKTRGVFPPPPPNDRSWLADRLQLSDEQKQQIQQIWSEAMPRNRDQSMEKRRALQKQRNDALRAMLTPSQQTRFDQIEAQYETASADLQKERGKGVQEAIARTKLILNAQQRTKYDEILKLRDADHQGWENGHRSATGPADRMPPPPPPGM